MPRGFRIIQAIDVEPAGVGQEVVGGNRLIPIAPDLDAIEIVVQIPTQIQRSVLCKLQNRDRREDLGNRGYAEESLPSHHRAVGAHIGQAEGFLKKDVVGRDDTDHGARDVRVSHELLEVDVPEILNEASVPWIQICPSGCVRCNAGVDQEPEHDEPPVDSVWVPTGGRATHHQ